MTESDRAGAVGRAVGAVKAAGWKARAKQAAASLKAEYAAGKQGDTSPAAPIWPTPKEQLEALIGLLRSSKDSSEPHAPPPVNESLDADAVEVTDALRGVDWARVRAATAERTGDATKAMRAMADQVDWAKVQPLAAHMSSALIAAVASGQVPIGGRLGSTVAKAIVDQGGLAQRVAQNLDDAKVQLPPDFRGAIEATSREIGGLRSEPSKAGDG